MFKKFIADFHIHSRFSRATSREINLINLAKWAKIKGIDVLGTGDFTHPLWFKELAGGLEPAEKGLYQLKDQLSNNKTRFILTTEISCIYSKNGKVRKIHLIVFAPNLEDVEKINNRLGYIGNLKSDGRPILGIGAKELLKVILEVSPDSFMVPAHCLLPDTVVHTKDNLLKSIQDIRKGDFVITHKNRWRRVKGVFKRPYNGKVYHIKPRNFSLGLTTTSEHPFYAIKTHKNCHWSKGICKPSHVNLNDCRNKYFEDYKPEWILAEKLERGDVLIYPRFSDIFQNHKEIDLKKIAKEADLEINSHKGFIALVGNRRTKIKQFIPIDKNFCKLAGYYLAEGYTNNRDLIGFAFSDKEKNYIEDVIDLMKKVFGFDKQPKLKTNKTGGIEILFYSKILLKIFQQLFYSSNIIQNAGTKALPAWTLGLSLDLQVELFKCWWRGDSGYTASRLLMNQMKIILLRLGIIPSIYVDKKEDYNNRPKHLIKGRKIRARYNMYSLHRLSFYEDKFNLLREPEFTEVVKYNRGQKYGWIDKDYIYLPIYDIKVENHKGEVYNLEIEEDNSYVCEFTTVHNCWTPWFAIFGSKSGFDSVEECFGDYAKHIFALETGLSSDPKMNWRLSALDKFTLISNSDAHSLRKLGREANIFEGNSISYQQIIEALKKNNQGLKLVYTIEFFPEEGKYHYDGHRSCNVVFSPAETKRTKGLCPVCGRPLTIGVLNRVDELADRSGGQMPTNAIPFKSLVPLQEIIAEAFGVLPLSKRVEEEYQNMINKFGNEFNILLETPKEELIALALPEIAEGILRVREGKVTMEPGYDGVFGKVKALGREEQKIVSKQKTLF